MKTISYIFAILVSLLISIIVSVHDVSAGSCSGCQNFIRGEANGDCVINVADIISISNYLFAGQSISCELAVDSNGDGRTDVADAIYLSNFLFADGKLPPSPFPEPSECSDDNHCTRGSCVNFKCEQTCIYGGRKDCADKNEKTNEYSDNSAIILPEFQASKKKTAFLVSDKDWRAILSLVPASVWTDKQGKVHYYPVLIYHAESPEQNSLQFTKSTFSDENAIKIIVLTIVKDLNN